MKSDRRSFFFSTTLSEIGFILFFALLIFAFYQHQRDQRKLEAAADENVGLGVELESREQAFADIQKRLEFASEEEREAFFDELVPHLTLRERNEALESEAAAANQRLTELTEIEDLVADVSGGGEAAAREMRDALRLKQQVDDATGGAGVDPELVAEVLAARDVIARYNTRTDAPIADAASLEAGLEDALRARNLEGQVRNLVGRLGGRDLPPCWADRETGSVEYLFDIVITDAGLLVSPAAPDYRQVEYDAMTNTGRLTSGRIGIDTFATLSRPILAETNSRGCRHYVRITDLSENSYKHTLTIEDYFYKFVNRT